MQSRLWMLLTFFIGGVGFRPAIAEPAPRAVLEIRNSPDFSNPVRMPIDFGDIIEALGPGHGDYDATKVRVYALSETGVEIPIPTQFDPDESSRSKVKGQLSFSLVPALSKTKLLYVYFTPRGPTKMEPPPARDGASDAIVRTVTDNIRALEGEARENLKSLTDGPAKRHAQWVLAFLDQREAKPVFLYGHRAVLRRLLKALKNGEDPDQRIDWFHDKFTERRFVDNGKVGIGFMRTPDGLELQSVFDLTSAQELLSPTSESMFRIKLKTSDGEKTITSQSGWETVEITRPAINRVVLQFRAPHDPRLAGLTVRLMGTFTGGLVNWEFAPSVTPSERITVVESAFPILDAEAAARERLFVGKKAFGLAN